MSDSKKKLHDEILRVFAARSLPGKELIPDGKGRDEDYQRIARELGGKSWTQVPRPVVEKLRGSLSFFSAAGFQAHLPAFLAAALDDDDVREALVFALVPPKELSLRAHAEERQGLLSASERAVVSDVLGYLHRHHGEDFAGGETERAAKAWEPAKA